MKTSWIAIPLLLVVAACGSDSPVAPDTSTPVATAPVVVPAAAVPAPTAAPEAPEDTSESLSCKESFRVVPLNFAMRSQVLPARLRVRFVRAPGANLEWAHAAVFDARHPAGQQSLLDQVVGRFDNSGVMDLQVAIPSGLTVQVDFGCGQTPPATAHYGPNNYNGHVIGSVAPTETPTGTTGTQSCDTVKPALRAWTQPLNNRLTLFRVFAQGEWSGSGTGVIRIDGQTFIVSPGQIVSIDKEFGDPSAVVTVPVKLDVAQGDLVCTRQASCSRNTCTLS